MVRMILSSSRGNHARVFPHSGYLGLTPITVQGSLRLEVEEDHLLLDASSIEVRIRCYESESRSAAPGSKPSSVRTLYEVSETLWNVTDSQGAKKLWAPVGAFQKNWRLVVPVDAHLAGALSSMSFKAWRVWWAVEGVVYHKPAGMFGNRIMKSFPVTLVQHAHPPEAGPSDWQHAVPELGLHCTASLDRNTFGPAEDFSLRLSMSSNSKTPLRIKKTIVEVRREFCVQPNSSNDSSPRTPPQDLLALTTPDCYPELFPPSLRAISPCFSDDSCQPMKIKTPNDSEGKPTSPARMNPQEFSYFSLETAPAPLTIKTKREEISLLTMSKSDEVDLRNSCSTTFSGKLPKPNSLHHYAVGETCSTNSMYIRYYVAVKILCKTSRGTVTVDLPPQDIILVSTSALDRQLAIDRRSKVLLYQAAEERAFRTGRTRRSFSAEHNMNELLNSGIEEMTSPAIKIPTRRCSTALDSLACSAPEPPLNRRTSSSSAPLIPRQASNVHFDEYEESLQMEEDRMSASHFLLSDRPSGRGSINFSFSATKILKRNSEGSADSGIAEHSLPNLNFSNFTLAPSSSSSNSPAFEISPRGSSRKDVGPKDRERKSRRNSTLDPMNSGDPNRPMSVPPRSSSATPEGSFAGRRKMSLFA